MRPDMWKRGYLTKLLLSVVAVGLMLLASCASVSEQDIKGLLQAVEGKEMVVTLSDGSQVRITVEDSQKSSSARQMVGKEVEVKVVTDKSGVKKLENVKRVGEDQKFTGKIESMGKDAWVIGGKTFKVDTKTILDGGLAMGVTAEVEFVVQADGSNLATQIETDEQDENKFKGQVQSISKESWTIGGQAFKVNEATRLDDGLAVGVTARVEFVTQPDGSLLAIEIETDQAQDRFNGVIESVSADNWVIGGRTFKVNAATRLDDGLIVGVKARVEFITLADGALLATEIETDEAEEKFGGVVESTATDKWIIGGRTFKVSTTTKIDPGLAVGLKSKVRFLAMPDGTMLATRIQEDRSGTGKEADFSGTVESISAAEWVIGGKKFKIMPATRIDGGLAVGSKVRVRFVTLADGSNLASRIELDKKSSSGSSSKDDSGKPAEGNKSKSEQTQKTEKAETVVDAEFRGIIESISPTAFVIGGKTFQVNSSTVLDNGLAVGVKARVEFVQQTDGSMLAIKIETDIKGTAESGDDKGGASGRSGSGGGGQ